MALSVKAGTFTLNTGTGNQSVTGVGFEPAYIQIIAAYKTALGHSITEDLRDIEGHYDGTSQFCAAYASEDNVGTSNCSRILDRDNLIVVPDVSAGSNLIEASPVSLDADGFTISVDVTDATAMIVSYLAIAGCDVDVGTFTHNGSTGNQAVTGVGFTPTGMRFVTSPVPTWDTPGTSSIKAIGFDDGTTAVNCAYYSMDGQATSDTSRHLDTGFSVGWITTSAIVFEAKVGSFDADGFTVNTTTTGGGSYEVGYVAFGGVSADVGTETIKTTTGTKATTGVGFQPEVMFIASMNSTTNDSLTATSLIVNAFSDGTTDYCINCADIDAKSTTELVNNHKAAFFETVSSTTGAVQTTSSLDSFDPDGFTINYTSVIGSARYFTFMCLRDAAAASSIKSIAGVAQANIKSMQGVAIASIKSVAGVSN